VATVRQPEPLVPPEPQPAPVAPAAITAAAAATFAVAGLHQATQAALTSQLIRAVLQVWATMSFRDLSRWWLNGPSEQVFNLVSMVQEIVASEAPAYIERSLATQGVRVRVPELEPKAFAGIAADGRSLDGLLLGGVVKTKERIRRGDSLDSAQASGAAFLTSAVQTTISDTRRAADQVSIVAAEPVTQESLFDDLAVDFVPELREDPPGSVAGRGKRRAPPKVGWVRMLTPPSCGRCAVLAGKFYGWNEGFLRHENCDCVHIPAVEATSDDLTTNPYDYFKSLSEADQNRYFGKANAEAIRDGADISQVVNASTRRGALYTADRGRRYTREGVTKKGFYGGHTESGRAGLRRITPWQIYQDARGDRDEAIRLLRQFGYIVR
jgi:hypothetical protein